MGIQESIMLKANQIVRSHKHEGAMPITWWVGVATLYGGNECSKCHSVTEGRYVPVDRWGECAIVESCRMCGSSHIRVRGKDWVPTIED